MPHHPEPHHRGKEGMAARIAGESLTPPQRAAVQERAVSVVLSSGAGCGKTHVLTQRYLAHLRDDGAEVGHILAVNLEDEARTRSLQKLLTAQVPTAVDLEEVVLLYGWRPVVSAVAHLMRAHEALAWPAWLARTPQAVAQAWEDFARNVLLPR